MKSGEVGVFRKRGGRGRWPRNTGRALSRQGIHFSQNLNRSYYSMKNRDIFYSVQIGFLICTVLRPDSMDWELWARYRSDPR
jgi:hypothetical protein